MPFFFRPTTRPFVGAGSQLDRLPVAPRARAGRRGASLHGRGGGERRTAKPVRRATAGLAASFETRRPVFGPRLLHTPRPAAGLRRVCGGRAAKRRQSRLVSTRRASRRRAASADADAPRDLPVALPVGALVGDRGVVHRRLDPPGGVDRPRRDRVLAGRGVGQSSDQTFQANSASSLRSIVAGVQAPPSIRTSTRATGAAPGRADDPVPLPSRVTRAGADFSSARPTEVSTASFRPAAAN